ncbi:MAG: hypothetical protein J0H25_15245 [Rhizobiales bacterium]|nr:hypothetical protein [Hyphomicrobiales bacterium]
MIGVMSAAMTAVTAVTAMSELAVSEMPDADVGRADDQGQRREDETEQKRSKQDRIERVMDFKNAIQHAVRVLSFESSRTPFRCRPRCRPMIA